MAPSAGAAITETSGTAVRTIADQQNSMHQGTSRYRKIRIPGHLPHQSKLSGTESARAVFPADAGTGTRTEAAGAGAMAPCREIPSTVNRNPRLRCPVSHRPRIPGTAYARPPVRDRIPMGR
jgi:hypothetical protein